MKIRPFTKQEIEHYLAIGILREQLANKIEPFTSIAANSIPQAGSHTAPLDKLDENELFIQMVGIALHNTGDFTVLTKLCNVRFWLTEDYKLLYLAHKDKRRVMNNMTNRKYNCGDLYDKS